MTVPVLSCDTPPVTVTSAAVKVSSLSALVLKVRLISWLPKVMVLAVPSTFTAFVPKVAPLMLPSVPYTTVSVCASAMLKLLRSSFKVSVPSASSVVAPCIAAIVLVVSCPMSCPVFFPLR